MRTGCIVAALVLLIAIGIAGYFGYQMINESFNIPEELEAYADPGLMRMRLKSTTPAPPDTAHLTPERVAQFIGALDSLGSGWQGLAIMLDSLQSDDNGESKVTIWTSPAIIQQMMHTPLAMRRALVSYLNNNNISWAEYIWLKEHTIAASGITLHETDSSLNAVVSTHTKLNSTDLIPTQSKESTSNFFNRIEQLRKSGAIDSSDIALVAPYRQALLSKGLPALACIDTKEKVLDAGIHIKTSQE